jgi:hypothetical protein
MGFGNNFKLTSDARPWENFQQAARALLSIMGLRRQRVRDDDHQLPLRDKQMIMAMHRVTINHDSGEKPW